MMAHRGAQIFFLSLKRFHISTYCSVSSLIISFGSPHSHKWAHCPRRRSLLYGLYRCRYIEVAGAHCITYCNPKSHHSVCMCLHYLTAGVTSLEIRSVQSLNGSFSVCFHRIFILQKTSLIL